MSTGTVDWELRKDIKRQKNWKLTSIGPHYPKPLLQHTHNNPRVPLYPPSKAPGNTKTPRRIARRENTQRGADSKTTFPPPASRAEAGPSILNITTKRYKYRRRSTVFFLDA